MQAQVRVDGKWSAWFSWGKWNSWSAVGSENKAIKDELAVMDIDTLKVTKGKMADSLVLPSPFWRRVGWCFTGAISGKWPDAFAHFQS